ncbi:hypothetical protein BDV19DRAFT_386655 [Aspergillus venezuelensis]
MSSASLPPGLFYLIISHIGNEPLATYATINRQWQADVERRIFSTLKLTTARLDGLRKFITAERCSYVRNIELKVILPEYSIAQRIKVESSEDQCRNNEAFTHTICTFFDILSTWPQELKIAVLIRKEDPGKEEQPHWPTLTHFSLINYAASTPSGTWLFTGDTRVPEYVFPRDRGTLYMRPPMNDAPQDVFPDDYRTHPAPVLYRLYIAAGRAAQNIPRLRKMELVAALQVGEHSKLAAGVLECEARHAFRDERVKGRAFWEGTTAFELEGETRGVWRRVGKGHGLGIGGLVIENNLVEDHGDLL